MQKRRAIASLALAGALAGTGVTTISMPVMAAPNATEKVTQIQSAKDVKYGKISASDRKILEGLFDYDYYVENNPDVVKAYGNDRAAIFKHFYTKGIFEGRACSSTFNASAYASAYGDLQKAYGNDIMSYYRHYSKFGKSEGRTLTTVNACNNAGIAVYQINNVTTNGVAPAAKAANAAVVANGPAASAATSTSASVGGSPSAGSIFGGLFGGFIPSTPSKPSTPTNPTPGQDDEEDITPAQYRKKVVVDASEATYLSTREGYTYNSDADKYYSVAAADAAEATTTNLNDGYVTTMVGETPAVFKITGEATQEDAVAEVRIRDGYIRVDDEYKTVVTADTALQLKANIAEADGVFYDTTTGVAEDPADTETYVEVEGQWYEIVAAEDAKELKNAYGSTIINDETVYYSTGTVFDFMAEEEVLNPNYYATVNVVDGVATHSYYSIEAVEDISQAFSVTINEGYIYDEDTDSYYRLTEVDENTATELRLHDGYFVEEGGSSYYKYVDATKEEATHIQTKDGYRVVVTDEVTTYFKVEAVADWHDALENVNVKEGIYEDAEGNRFYEITATDKIDSDVIHTVLKDGHVTLNNTTYKAVAISDTAEEGFAYDEETGKYIKFTVVTREAALDEQGQLKEGFVAETETLYYAVGDEIDSSVATTTLVDGYAKTDEDVYYRDTALEGDALEAAYTLKANVAEADGVFYDTTTGVAEDPSDAERYVEVEGQWYEIVAAEDAKELAAGYIVIDDHVYATADENDATTGSHIKTGYSQIGDKYYETASIISKTEDEATETHTDEGYVKIGDTWYEIGEEVTSFDVIYDYDVKDGYEIVDDNEDGTPDSANQITEVDASEATEEILNPGYEVVLN